LYIVIVVVVVVERFDVLMRLVGQVGRICRDRRDFGVR